MKAKSALTFPLSTGSVNENWQMDVTQLALTCAGWQMVKNFGCFSNSGFQKAHF